MSKTQPPHLPPFIDAHHHLWDLHACHYPWLMAHGQRRFFGDPAPIQRDYTVREFLQDAEGLPLRASVHIQVGVAPGEEVRETRWLQRTAADPESGGFPHAIVAAADLTDDALESMLDAHAKNPNLRGIRQIVGRAPSEDTTTGSGSLLTHPRWTAGLALLAERKLSFDLQAVPEQLESVARLLENIPNLHVAVCHAGSPWHRDVAGWRRWEDGLRALAARPHTWCKLSGFGMFDHDWTAERIRPIVDTVLGIFGCERVMLGSNFPVDRLYGSYRSVWAAYAELTRALADAERAALFHDNARRFYRID